MKHIFEFFEYSNHYDELLEMANITQKATGIKDVVIWIGPNPPQHGKRIKVSNSPNNFDVSDSFVITIPEYKVIGDVNTKFITSSVFSKIIEFLKVNKNIIDDYSDRKISTEDLLEGIIKV